MTTLRIKPCEAETVTVPKKHIKDFVADQRETLEECRKVLAMVDAELTKLERHHKPETRLTHKLLD